MSAERREVSIFLSTLCHAYAVQVHAAAILIFPMASSCLQAAFPPTSNFRWEYIFFAGLQFELSFRFIGSWTVLEIFIWAFGPCLFFTHLDFVHDNVGNKFCLSWYLQVLDLHILSST